VELHKTQAAAEAAVGQGSVKALWEMQTYKKKNYSPISLFLFSSNVDLKNNNRECRKPF